MDREKLIRILNRGSILVYVGVMVIWLYVAANGIGLTDGSFGPGAYYYSDIPNWQEIFYGEDKLVVKMQYPFLIAAIFIVMAIGYFKLLVWGDKKD